MILSSPSHYSLPQLDDKPLKTSVLMGWKFPPSRFSKLNMDNSVIGNPSHTSVGGLIRDNEENGYVIPIVALESQILLGIV